MWQHNVSVSICKSHGAVGGVDMQMVVRLASMLGRVEHNSAKGAVTDTGDLTQSRSISKTIELSVALTSTQLAVADSLSIVRQVEH